MILCAAHRIPIWPVRLGPMSLGSDGPGSIAQLNQGWMACRGAKAATLPSHAKIEINSSSEPAVGAG
jgi:hypothetical protein